MSNLDAVIEISPGAGGKESQRTAELLSEMYRAWGAFKGVAASHEFVGAVPLSYRHLVTIPGAYDRLRHESGVHRVVRTPPEDGRRHTSYASVLVFGGRDAYEARHDELTGSDDIGINWSSQVRSYVFNPVIAAGVKDHRTEVRVEDVHSVVNGGRGLDVLLDAFK